MLFRSLVVRSCGANTYATLPNFLFRRSQVLTSLTQQAQITNNPVRFHRRSTQRSPADPPPGFPQELDGCVNTILLV